MALGNADGSGFGEGGYSGGGAFSGAYGGMDTGDWAGRHKQELGNYAQQAVQGAIDRAKKESIWSAMKMMLGLVSMNPVSVAQNAITMATNSNFFDAMGVPGSSVQSQDPGTGIGGSAKGFLRGIGISSDDDIAGFINGILAKGQ